MFIKTFIYRFISPLFKLGDKDSEIKYLIEIIKKIRVNY